MDTEIVNIAVRIRPLLPNETKNIVNHIEEENVLIVADKRNVFAFDQIFPLSSSQLDVYNKIITPLLQKVLAGYNATVLAYGQTGTGKTYTMGTDIKKINVENSGLLARVLDDTFENLENNLNMTVAVSFIEIYNEKVYDLLSPKKNALVVKGFRVQEMSIQPVDSQIDARQWLDTGSQSRHVGHTNLNGNSSRSHAIFTIHYTKNGVTSKLHLVDLAGSESVRRTGNKGKAFKEGVTINKGLLAIGKVIAALTKESKLIPYRESTLTTILQDSLNTNNYVSLLACISPSSKDINETLVTLRFAEKAKILKSRPQLVSIATEFEKTHPGALEAVEGYGTVKKQSKYSIFTSTQRKDKKASIATNLFNSSQLQAPVSPVDMDILSVSTSPVAEDAVPVTTTLQPLIRRFTKQLENNLTHLQNNLETLQNGQEKNDAEDRIAKVLSRVPWNTIANGVTQYVKEGMSQKKNMDKIQHQLFGTRKQLAFDEQPLATELDESNVEIPPIEPPEPDFKVPIVGPSKKRKSTRQSSLQLEENRLVRRSTRLSMKISNNIEPVVEIKDKTPNKNRKYLSDITNTPKRMKMNEDVLKFNIANDVSTERCSFTSATTPADKSRKSVRLSLKYRETAAHCPTPAPRMSLLKSTPVPAPRTTLPNLTKTVDKKQKSLNRAPTLENHRKNILATINTGTQKQLQTLHTVGIKTAAQIIQYRTFKGGFDSFEDLRKMPSWRGNSFNRFMESNLLT